MHLLVEAIKIVINGMINVHRGWGGGVFESHLIPFIPLRTLTVSVAAPGTNIKSFGQISVMWMFQAQSVCSPISIPTISLVLHQYMYIYKNFFF